MPRRAQSSTVETGASSRFAEAQAFGERRARYIQARSHFRGRLRTHVETKDDGGQAGTSHHSEKWAPSSALPRQAAAPGAVRIRAPPSRSIGTHRWYPYCINSLGPPPRKRKIPANHGISRARPERFELPTFGSVDRRSIQLSYGRRGPQSTVAASPGPGRAARLTAAPTRSPSANAHHRCCGAHTGTRPATCPGRAGRR